MSLSKHLDSVSLHIPEIKDLIEGYLRHWTLHFDIAGRCYYGYALLNESHWYFYPSGNSQYKNQPAEPEQLLDPNRIASQLRFIKVSTVDLNNKYRMVEMDGCWLNVPYWYINISPIVHPNWPPMKPRIDCSVDLSREKNQPTKSWAEVKSEVIACDGEGLAVYIGQCIDKLCPGSSLEIMKALLAKCNYNSITNPDK